MDQIEFCQNGLRPEIFGAGLGYYLCRPAPVPRIAQRGTCGLDRVAHAAGRAAQPPAYFNVVPQNMVSPVVIDTDLAQGFARVVLHAPTPMPVGVPQGLVTGQFRFGLHPRDGTAQIRHPVLIRVER